MIVAETDDGFRFVTQPDHADLAGQFAERWGNDRFDPPAPYAACVLAAHDHDDGWSSFDCRPRVHDDGTPIDFREMPADPWVDLYEAGIEAVAEADPYAGLLVSMHGAGLRNRRYGLSPSWPETQAAFREFVEREEARQSRLAAELRTSDGPSRLSGADVDLLSTMHETGSAPTDTDSRLWRNYELLQAWDTLSLSFSTSVSPPSYPGISSVPRGAPGSEVSLTVEALGDGEFRVEPYPFGVEPLEVTVPTRTVRRADFDDEASLFEAYYGAERETVAFRIRRGGR